MSDVDRSSTQSRLDVAKYFSTRAPNYDEERSRNWSNDTEFKRVIKGLVVEVVGQCPNGGCIIDVGCGTGRGTLEAVSFHGHRDIQFIGLDLSSDMLRRFLSKSEIRRRHVSALRVDAHALPIMNSAVDIAISLSVLPYLNAGQFAQELSRVCKPRAIALIGCVVLSRHDRAEWRNFSNDNGWHIPRLIHGDRIDAAMERCGFVSGRAVTVRYKRYFSDLLHDKRKTASKVALTRDIEIFRNAPLPMKHAYCIDDAGFVQQYYARLYARI